MQKNIQALYIIKFSKWFMLIMPVVALFYIENGLQASDIFILKAIYSLSTGLMEIPSGYLSDIYGRKKTLIWGTILGTAGFVIYSGSSNISGFICAEIMLGIGQSFISGADSALLYDSLKAMRKENQFLKHEGRITAMGNYAETTAIIIGGTIASLIAVRSVYIAQTLIMAVSIPAAFMLKEPIRNIPRRKENIKAIITVAKESIIHNQILGSAILLSSTVGLATLTMAWGAQAYLVEHDFSELGMTTMLVGLNFTVAGISLFSHRITDFFTPKFSLLIIVIGIPIGYLALGTLPLTIAIAFLFIFYAIRGLATPILKDYINKNCGSEYRATVLSIRSLIIRIGFATLGSLIAVFSKNWGIETAFTISFVLLSFAILTVAFWFFRVRHPQAGVASHFLLNRKSKNKIRH